MFINHKKWTDFESKSFQTDFASTLEERFVKEPSKDGTMSQDEFSQNTNTFRR